MRWILVLSLAAVAGACRAPTTADDGRAHATPTASPAGPAVTPLPGQPEDAVGRTETPGARTLPSAGAPTGGDGAAAAAAAARQAVAGELGLEPGDVRVVSVEAVTWPDSSLGCPEPNQLYMQVLTPGYLVLVDAGGRTTEVHTDKSTPPRVARCANPRPPIAQSSED